MYQILQRVFLAAALVAAASFPSAAQGPVAWEPLPSTAQTVNQRAKVFALTLGTHPDGSLAVYVYSSRTFSLNANEQGWTEMCRRSGCYSTALLARDSVIIGGTSNRASRSGDYGQTWNTDGIKGFEAMIWGANPGTDGAILAARVFSLWRSDDRGLTFTELGTFGGDTIDIAEVPASGALPRGRILAAAYNGVTYSDDDGLTFAPSSLYQAGVLIAHSVTFAPEAGHPYGGAAYAAVGENQPGQSRRASVIYRSDDGGATWVEVHRILEGDYGLEETDRALVRGARDGSLWVGVGFTLIRPTNRSTMLVTRDGGTTFKEEAEGWGGHSPNHIRMAPDGRVYVATDSVVWRTTESVVVSTSEPPEASGAALRVDPNPSSGAARITLSLDTPEAVMLSVFDARGREVWSKASGARSEHAWEVDTSAWAAGVYVVRAEVGGEVVMAQMTVVR